LLSWFCLLQNSLIPAGLAWEEMLLPLYQKYKSAITWGDQDLLNIIFYYNPGKCSFHNATVYKYSHLISQGTFQA
jgi:hypothetical protein